MFTLFKDNLYKVNTDMYFINPTRYETIEITRVNPIFTFRLIREKTIILNTRC